jgi:hypothetical protein
VSAKRKGKRKRTRGHELRDQEQKRKAKERKEGMMEHNASGEEGWAC